MKTFHDTEPRKWRLLSVRDELGSLLKDCRDPPAILTAKKIVAREKRVGYAVWKGACTDGRSATHFLNKRDLIAIVRGRVVLNKEDLGFRVRNLMSGLQYVLPEFRNGGEIAEFKIAEPLPAAFRFIVTVGSPTHHLIFLEASEDFAVQDFFDRSPMNIYFWDIEDI